MVLFSSRACGDARSEPDLELLLIVAGSFTPEREKRLHRRVRYLLLLPLNLNLLISDAATISRWAGSRWHMIDPIATSIQNGCLSTSLESDVT